MRIIPPLILVLLGSFVLQGQFTITIREICEETSCTNGKDDDGDGFIDCLDDECFDKNPCRCLKSNQKNSNWDLIANPPVSCDSQNDTITVSINGLDSVPNTERRVIWSNGELDVYSITLIPADLDSPFIEVRIIEQDQCEEVKRIDISTSIITFDLTTSWNMGDSLWCNNWTDSTVLSVDNISSGNMHEIVWSTGDNTLDITYFPNQHMANDGDSVIVWVKIKDSNGGCGRKEFQIRRIECPCPGDPVISPLTAETVKADGDTITIGGLYGCTRYTNTQCTRIYEGTSYNDWHGGVDISEKVGDTIYSMYEGKVIRAISPCDSLNDYCDNFNRGTCTDELGNQIKIRSSINNQTNAILYGHLKEVLVSNNQNVKADQIIGTIGKTGNACREYIIAHVHIQVKDSITQTRFDVQDLLTTKFNDDATQDSTCIN